MAARKQVARRKNPLDTSTSKPTDAFLRVLDAIEQDESFRRRLGSEQSPTLAEILSYKLPDGRWRIDGDDYATLVWEAGNTIPKPTEAEIRAFSSEVTGLMAQERRKRAALDILIADPDAVFSGFEITLAAIIAIYNVLSNGQKTTINTNAPGVVQAVQNMDARLKQIRAQIT